MSWVRVFSLATVIGREDLRQFWSSWRVWLAAHALRVATTASTWILLGRMLGSEVTVQFILVGQIVIVGAHFSGWALQAFTWDRGHRGTFPMLVATPTSLVPVMMGRTVIWLANGVATSLVTLLVLVPIFGRTLQPWRVASTIPLLLLTCSSSYAFAFSLGSLINWVPRARNIVQNLTITLITGICGVVVPIGFWPTPVQRLASVLPVTHGLAAIRLVLDGAGFRLVSWQILMEALVGVVWLAAGVVALDITTNLARRAGTLELG